MPGQALSLGLRGALQMQTENNYAFGVMWLPQFALDPPTDREVKASDRGNRAINFGRQLLLRLQLNGGC